MRKRRHLLVSISVLGAFLLLLFTGSIVFREPKYDGKTVREWIYLLDPHVDFRAQHDLAAEAIARIGSRAIPTIRETLQEPETTPLTRLKTLAQRFGLLPRDTLSLADRQYRASRAAYQIAERADADISALVPLLSYHLTNSNYADVENGRALANAGPAGIAVLTNLATHSDPRFRDRAIVSLQHARSQPGVFETYLRTVHDPDQNIRFSATSALARYPKADPNLLVPLALERLAGGPLCESSRPSSAILARCLLLPRPLRTPMLRSDPRPLAPWNATTHKCSERRPAQTPRV